VLEGGQGGQEGQRIGDSCDTVDGLDTCCDGDVGAGAGLQARLGRLLRRGQDSPDRKAAALCRQLRKWWPALWTFARVDGVDPTNNVAERALRPAVLWRKGSFGSASEAGSRFAERLLTVAASCRQHGRPLLAFLVAAEEAALRGSPPPSLLPAPAGG
jgi:transposase